MSDTLKYVLRKTTFRLSTLRKFFWRPQFMFDRYHQFGVVRTHICLRLFWLEVCLYREAKSGKKERHNLLNCRYHVNCKKHRGKLLQGAARHYGAAAGLTFKAVQGYLSDCKFFYQQLGPIKFLSNLWQDIKMKANSVYRTCLLHLGQWAANRLGDHPWSSKCNYCGFTYHGPLALMYTKKGMVTHDCEGIHKTISQLRLSLIREFNSRLDFDQAVRDANEDLYILLGAFDTLLHDLDDSGDLDAGPSRYVDIVSEVAEEILSSDPLMAGLRAELYSRGRMLAAQGIEVL